MLKKLFSHTAIYGLAPQVSKLAYFVALPFITRYLTDVDFGVQGIMTAYTTALSAFASLGLTVVLTNSFYKSPIHYKWKWRQIYGFLSIWNLAYAVVLGGLIYTVVPPEAANNKWPIVMLNVGPLVFFGQTQTIGTQFFRVRQMPFQIASRTAAQGLINVVLSIIFIRYYKMGYMGWFYATFISGMIINVSYWVPLNFTYKMSPIYNFKWKYMSKSIGVSVPTIPHYYSTYLLNNSDRLVMNQLKVDTGDVGKYNVAYTLGNVFMAISTAAGLAVSPLMNELYKKDNDGEARNLIFNLQYVFLVATFVVSIWSKEIFGILMKSPALAATYPMSIWIIMSYNYRPMYFGANNKIFYLEKTKVLWKITFIAGVLNVFLNVIGIPLFGFQFAAITTFVSFMYMGYSGFYLKVFKEINKANYYPVFWMVTTIGLTAAAIFAVELNIVYKGILTGGFAVLSLLGFLNMKSLIIKFNI